MALETTDKGIVHNWVAAESGWAGHMNNNLKRLSALGAYPFSVDPVASVYPDLVVRGGPVRLRDGTWSFLESTTLTLTFTDVHYVERDREGVVSLNPTGFTAGRIPIAVVETDTGVIVSVEDWRPAPELPIPADGLTPRFKLATQDVTNAGLTADAELAFAVEAGATYLVEALLVVSGSATAGDYTFDFQVDAGTMKGRGQVVHLGSALAIATTAINAAATAALAAPVVVGTDGDVDLPSTVRATFAFTASAAATFGLRFGNATPDTGRISRTWQGSLLRYRRVG